MESGVIIEYHREQYSVLLDGDGTEIIAQPRIWEALEEKRRKCELSLEGQVVLAQQLTVGDRVLVSRADQEHYLIEDIEPRRTFLARRGTNRYAYHYQLVVANADQLAVVVSPNPRIKTAVIDRYMLAGINGGLQPLLVVNKVDTDDSLRESSELKAYSRFGYPVHFTSALRGDGMAGLADALEGKFTAFCGQSGVGKSTILSALTGVHIATGQTKRRMGTGRQTTVSTRLYRLPGGGQVVDTPGIRVFGLAGLTQDDVREYFRDVTELARGCAYGDCTHTHEPGCRVKAAYEAGEISRNRVESCHKLLNEADQRERKKAF
jgi:ribosome biogenesis GTPase